MSNSALAPGVVLRSPKREYTIRRVLGQGGFGITYLVDSPFKMDNITFKGKFAIKEHFLQILCGREKGTSKVSYMENSAGEVERSLRAFVAEAQRLQKLGINHRNIVEVSEVFECNNTAYYVMEYLEGESLASYVRGHGGRLTFGETAQLMCPICEAVAMLHTNRVAHYDIKPQNIMIQQGDDGLRPVLIDFGLAKHYDGQGQATSSIAAAGYTPGYAPLEQYAGLRQFSPTADVYSLAATICFCLTGHTPAKADELNLDTLCDELLSLGVDDAVANVLLQALELRPTDRPADAGVFTAALFQGVALSTARRPRSAGYSIPNAQPMSASPAPAPAWPESAQPAASSRRRWLIPGIAASAIVFALIICLVLGVFKKDPAEIEKERQAYWTEQGEELMNDFEVQLNQYMESVPQTQEAMQQAQTDFIREKLPGFIERGKAIISGYETDCPNRRETATITGVRQFVNQMEFYIKSVLPAAQSAEEAPAAEEVPAAPAK